MVGNMMAVLFPAPLNMVGDRSRDPQRSIYPGKAISLGVVLVSESPEAAEHCC